ncbi:hypothetical protein ACFSKW_43680, partial [Nonomuraea mangrovi]
MAGTIVLAALTACRPVESAQTSLAPPSFTASFDPLASVKDSILNAYRGMWRDFADAAHTADWNDPDIADHTTGDAEAKLRYGLFLASKKGQVVKGDPLSPFHRDAAGHRRVTESPLLT